MNEFVHAACLPTKPAKTDQRCYASGWGKVKTYRESTELMFAPLDILDYDECYNELDKELILLDPEKFQKHYDESIRWDLCTSNRPKSICPGDSGGPFICDEDGKAVVHGIASSIIRGN